MSTFERMIRFGHERVCFHHDPETGLRAIIAVHSTKLGNALGGTRRWHYASEDAALHDVLRLSEAMTFKAAAADLPMGGAKSVVLLPRHGHAATEAEARAMGRFVDTINGEYIAAEDVGTDPQYMDWMALETRHVTGGIQRSQGGNPAPYTARGVVYAMRAALAHLGGPADFRGLTIAIQGVGQVGFHLAGYLAEAGAQLVVADVAAERAERAARELGARVVAPQEVLTVECDILSPCALGGVVDASLARRLRCRILAAAANNDLDDPEASAVLLKNLGILYVPAFISNAGGLIHLAGTYLGMSERELERKIAGIEATVARVLRDGEETTSTYAAAVALAQRRIEDGEPARREKARAR
jgi:leucine dehydrogenase